MERGGGEVFHWQVSLFNRTCTKKNKSPPFCVLKPCKRHYPVNTNHTYKSIYINLNRRNFFLSFSHCIISENEACSICHAVSE